MALFSRSLKPGSDDASSGANGNVAAEGAPRHTVGELLRETRESYGGEIDRIAATLRIRAAYLSAIEQSHYDELPGPVYAQGFVRAYAVHLGLDGNEAVRRFKQEIAGFEVSRDLSFPVPLTERSIPGGTMVLAALILAICGYGLWYYVSTSDRSHPERVSAVPPDLIAASQTPSNAAVPAAAPAAETSATSSPIVPTTAASPSPASPAAPSTAAAPLSLPAAVPASAAPGGVAVPAPAALTAPVVAPPVASVSAPAETASAPATAALSPTPGDANAATPPVQPRVYGASPGVPTRIIVHAVKDSWVQLRNGDEVLIQHTLHPGDSIRVPDESGLSLRTGNGAGLQLEIDGKLGKPLSGTVRTVALDPSRLARGGTPPNE
jgi:cytoskeleton protein RodZ